MTPAPKSLSELQVAHMLPDVELPAASGGRSISLRSAQGKTTAVVWLHPFGCVECDRYLQSLAALEDEFRVWDARLLVLVSSATCRTGPIPFGTLVTNDGLLMQGAGLVVADRYGQVFYVARADAGHILPSPRELTEWLKHLGTLCPE